MKWRFDAEVCSAHKASSSMGRINSPQDCYTFIYVRLLWAFGNESRSPDSEQQTQGFPQGSEVMLVWDRKPAARALGDSALPPVCRLILTCFMSHNAHSVNLFASFCSGRNLSVQVKMDMQVSCRESGAPLTCVRVLPTAL